MSTARPPEGAVPRPLAEGKGAARPAGHPGGAYPDSALACVTGRFQPVHRQHLSLFEIALAHSDHLLVAITNPDSGALQADPASPHRHMLTANPFSYYERARLIGAALQERGVGARCTLVPFDLARPDLWQQYVPAHALQVVRAYSLWEHEKARRFERGGYTVHLLEGDTDSKVSASAIRAELRSGGPAWRALVPPATVPLLEQMLADRPMEARA